jgi:hypothetical protein
MHSVPSTAFGVVDQTAVPGIICYYTLRGSPGIIEPTFLVAIKHSTFEELCL